MGHARCCYNRPAMRIRPWEPLPNFTSYYLLLSKEVLREFVRLGWSQVIAILLAVLILIFQIQFGLVPHELEWATVQSVLWPYLLVLSAFVILALIRAPVKIDNARIQDHKTLKELAESQTARIATLETKRERNAEQRHHYDMAKTAIEKHGETGKAVLRHLINYGRVVFDDYSPVQPPPNMTGAAFRTALNELTGSHVVVYTSIARSGNHEYTYAIAPGVEAAMKELLY